MITLNQTHSKKFHCTYLLHYYPFDTQVSKEYNEHIYYMNNNNKNIILW